MIATCHAFLNKENHFAFDDETTSALQQDMRHDAKTLKLTAHIHFFN